MKRAFTLIELIFTIVIMAGIFAVIPKILSATSRSDTFVLKQDALLSAYSLTSLASHLAWDENNTDSLSILATTDNIIECNTTTQKRKGGFLGHNSRTCKDILSASAIGADSGETSYLVYDDIDDFNSSDPIDVNNSLGQTVYEINTSVAYLDDNIISVNGTHMDIILDNTVTNKTTNIKKFTANVRYVGNRGRAQNIASFYYYSANLGQMLLNEEAW